MKKIGTNMPYEIDEKPLSILSLIELRAKKVLPGQNALIIAAMCRELSLTKSKKAQ
jgi:hypothetical protein